MEVTMHELTNSDACQKRRRFEYVFSPRTAEHMEKALAIKTVIKDVLFNGLRKEHIKAVLEGKMESMSYPSDAQKAIYIADAYRQIMRYLNSEKRQLTQAISAWVSLGDELKVRVNPDLVFMTNEEIEVIKLKTSKPNVTQRGAYEDMGLYAMHLYGRSLVPVGEKRIVKASYYFLRKANDSASKDASNFDEDFFLNTGGRNIVSVSGEYEDITSKKPTDMDLMFMNKVEAYIDGLREEECREEDCEKCGLKEICKYVDPPAVLEKEPKNHSLKDLSLTSAQETVIEHDSGILRVNAGAGAGKTMVVALRTATLLNKGAKPEELLLITFTNAGAEEMRTRIKLILDDFGIDVDASKLRIETFNAFGDRVVQNEYAKLGFTSQPKLIDDVERARIIAELLNKKEIADLDYRNFETNMRSCVGALEIAKSVFNIVKTKGFSLGDERKILEDLDWKGRFASLTAIKGLITLYDEYDDMLRRDGLIEYADQMVLIKEVLHQDPFYMERFGFAHITIDEFQDTDADQIELIKTLIQCPSFKSLMVVGDDSQSIFGFRDTTPEYIIHFEEVIGHKIEDVQLVENHRSTPQVIGFANKVNETRRERLEKDLVAVRPNGKPVTVKGFLSKAEEQEYVLDQIKWQIEIAGKKPEDIAVIAATKYELMEMGDILKKAGIPSVMLNPEPLLENGRVRAAIALFRFLLDGNEEDGLIYANAKLGGGVMAMSAKEIEGALGLAMTDKDMFWIKENEEEKKEFLIGLLKDLSHNDEVYDSFASSFERKSLAKCFEYAGDFSRFGTNAAFRRIHDYPGVVLTTAHSSKGLEWDVVYCMISKFDAPELHVLSSRGRDRKEERIRLLFVAVTRARDELTVTGQYIAFGKRGEYTLNQFLRTAASCVGDDISQTEVELQLHAREEEKKARKKDAS